MDVRVRLIAELALIPQGERAEIIRALRCLVDAARGQAAAISTMEVTGE